MKDTMHNSYQGYGNTPPTVRWPGDARLAVSFVLNIEEGAQLSLVAGDEANEGQHEVRNQILGTPDLCMESHFEYGARVGVVRILRELQRYNLPLTLNVCARALETTPWIAKTAQEHGYEMCCHGWRWESHAGFEESYERELIDRCVQSITRLWGRRPAGWHTKSSASINTRRLLREKGFTYDSDAYNDDAPYYVDVDGQPHLVLPYSFDTNDMRFFEGYQFVHARDFADYVIASFDELWQEGAEVSRMMTIGLHTRIIGRPGRISGLRQVIEYINNHQGVWVSTREQIARHWLQHSPPPVLKPEVQQK